ncbi:hypothetical protein Peur_025678 [Populus x canadensis]
MFWWLGFCMGFETSGFWAETSLVCDGEDRSWFNGYSGGETVDLDGCLFFWLTEGERMGLWLLALIYWVFIEREVSEGFYWRV